MRLYILSISWLNDFNSISRLDAVRDGCAGLRCLAPALRQWFINLQVIYVVLWCVNRRFVPRSPHRFCVFIISNMAGLCCV